MLEEAVQEQGAAVRRLDDEETQSETQVAEKPAPSGSDACDARVAEAEEERDTESEAEKNQATNGNAHTFERDEEAAEEEASDLEHKKDTDDEELASSDSESVNVRILADFVDAVDISMHAQDSMALVQSRWAQIVDLDAATVSLKYDDSTIDPAATAAALGFAPGGLYAVLAVPKEHAPMQQAAAHVPQAAALTHNPETLLPPLLASVHPDTVPQCACGAGRCAVFMARTEANHGRAFAACPRPHIQQGESCGFFQFLDEVQPPCPCGGMVRVLTTKNGVNRGKKFSKCVACGLFAWLDAPAAPSGTACFNCGETTHWARDCPKRRCV